MLTTPFSVVDLPWMLAHCNFEKTPTSLIVGFEAIIVMAAIAAGFFLAKIQEKVWIRYLLMAAGVLIFELFTGAMWNNHRLGPWAYIYWDISWILTVMWTTLFLTVVLVGDRLFSNWKEPKRFLIYLGIITPIAFLLEIVVVNLGIRSYAPEVLQSLSGIQLFNVPIEALYYIPVFSGLVISFYKYWCFVIEDQPLVPLKYQQWARNFFLAFLAIFLFEIMIEPMVKNQNFPQWSYIFHDISVVMTTLWILIVGAAAAVVGQFFGNYPTPIRFLIALSVTSSLALPLEAWLINHDYRVYGESVQHLYLGYQIPVFNVPFELAIAIPIYMALIIAFIRYWEAVIDNRL